MKFKIPRPLVTEHEELHEALVRATKVKARIGEAARERTAARTRAACRWQCRGRRHPAPPSIHSQALRWRYAY